MSRSELLKKNNLKKIRFRRFHFHGIKGFYNFAIENEVRYASVLIDDNFHFPFDKKMKVSLAAQVLRHSTAAGISTLVIS